MARFPLDVSVPAFDASSGQRQFGARREGGGRLHGGCDLYARHGTPIRAIADGVFKVRRSFYLSTDAVVVHHPGIGVVRYGEVMEAADYARERRAIAAANGGDPPARAPAYERDAPVKEGDVIAHVGDLTKIAACMLHFELYDEAAADDDLWGYTNRGRYERHPLLLDPTGMLQSLQRGGPAVPGVTPTGVQTYPAVRAPRRGRGRVAGGPIRFPDRRERRDDALAFARLASNDDEPAAEGGRWDDDAIAYRSTWRSG